MNPHDKHGSELTPKKSGDGAIIFVLIIIFIALYCLFFNALDSATTLPQ